MEVCENFAISYNGFAISDLNFQPTWPFCQCAIIWWVWIGFEPTLSAVFTTASLAAPILQVIVHFTHREAKPYFSIIAVSGI